MEIARHFLDRYLDPLAGALTPAIAERILNLRPDAEVVAYVVELAKKANAGTISEAERAEYRALADAGTLVALLKAKARRIVDSSIGNSQ